MVAGRSDPQDVGIPDLQDHLGAVARREGELDGAHLVYAAGINAQRDMAMARRLVERRVALDANDLADAAKPLAAMLKAKA